MTGKKTIVGNDIGRKDHINDLRVQLTFTLNVLESISAPSITVTGITKKWLPRSKCHSGCMIIVIKGLYPGGNIDLGMTLSTM